MEKDTAYTLFSKIKIPDDSIAKRLAIILSVGNRITVKKYANRDGPIYDLVAFMSKWNTVQTSRDDAPRRRKDSDKQKKSTCSILFDGNYRILGVRIEKVNSPDEKAQLLMRVNDSTVNAASETRFNEAVIALLYLFLDQKLTPDVKDFVTKTITEVFIVKSDVPELQSTANKTNETRKASAEDR